MADISIDVKGSEAAERRIREIGERATEYRQIARRLAPVFSRSGEERFSSDGFGKWPPLAESTKRRHGNHQILRLTGRLEASLTSLDATDVRGEGVSYGTDVDYAVFHQEGRGNPTREVVGTTPRQRDRLVATIQRYIVGSPS